MTRSIIIRDKVILFLIIQQGKSRKEWRAHKKIARHKVPGKEIFGE